MSSPRPNRWMAGSPGQATVTIRSEPRGDPAWPSLARGWLDREPVFSWLMMAPPLLFLAALVGYPFCYGILLSLQDRRWRTPARLSG